MRQVQKCHPDHGNRLPGEEQLDCFPVPSHCHISVCQTSNQPWAVYGKTVSWPYLNNPIYWQSGYHMSNTPGQWSRLDIWMKSTGCTEVHSYAADFFHCFISFFIIFQDSCSKHYGKKKPKKKHIATHDRWYLMIFKYRKNSNIRRNLVGNKTVDHSDVDGASPVGAAPTTSSFST